MRHCFIVLSLLVPLAGCAEGADVAGHQVQLELTCDGQIATGVVEFPDYAFVDDNATVEGEMIYGDFAIHRAEIGGDEHFWYREFLVRPWWDTDLPIQDEAIRCHFSSFLPSGRLEECLWSVTWSLIETFENQPAPVCHGRLVEL